MNTIMTLPNEKSAKQKLLLTLEQANLSARQNRLLALAAVFQSAQLTHLLALHGSQALNGINSAAFNCLLQASFDIQSKLHYSLFSLDFFQSFESLQIGLQALEGALMQPYQQSKPRLPAPAPYAEALRYAIALLQIERKVYRNAGFVEKITAQQKALKQRLNFFDNNLQHSAILASTANLYVETAGSLSSRLNVRGKPDMLKNQASIDRIRACLFAGLQAAHLWQELGGNRLQLIFGRRGMLEDIRAIARLHYEQSHQLPDIPS